MRSGVAVGLLVCRASLNERRKGRFRKCFARLSKGMSGMPVVTLRALEDIPMGKEILVDYGPNYR